MPRARILRSAIRDLDDIWLYIARDNPEAANKFIRSLVSRFPMLAFTPEIGRERKELSPHLRSFAIGNYVIFYRPMRNGVEIARVLHGARDLPPLFE